MPSGEGRVAFCRTPWWDRLEDGGRAALEQAASVLGAEEVELPPEFAGLTEAQETVMAFDVARNLEPEWRDHRDELSGAMRDYIERGRTVSAEDAEAGAAVRDRCAAMLPDVFAGFDALMVPGALGEAPLRAEGHTGDPLLCRAWTFLGVPALSVPGHGRAGGDAGGCAAGRARRGRGAGGGRLGGGCAGAPQRTTRHILNRFDTVLCRSFFDPERR